MHMLLILLTLCLRKSYGVSHLFSIVYAFAGNRWQPGGAGGGGAQASRVRGAPPLCAATAPTRARPNDPDRLHGAMVWDPARVGRPPAAPHPLSVLEPCPPPGPALADGQPL